MAVTVIGTNGPASASTPDGKSETALRVSQRR
jgi:hypothetical protein